MNTLKRDNSGAVHIKPLSEGGFSVSGALTFETVPALAHDSASVLSGGGDINLDLQGISHADSAGLALLIEWMRTARAQEKGIVFKNVPPQMLAMATMSGLENILPTA